MQEDIIVAGAGPAGLMSACELAKNGRKVLILEARDRIGGRAYTVHGQTGSYMELGAEFVHGNLPVTLSLLKAAGLSYTATAGTWMEVKSGASGELEYGHDWSLFMQKLKSVEEDMTLQNFLELHFPEARYAALKDHAISYAEGYDCADASRASVKALYEEWSAEQETQYRIDKGYTALMNFLAEQCKKAGCRILLSHPVSDIMLDEGSVNLTAAGNAFRADKVVVALPLGVLQREGSVRFSPAAPDYSNAFDQLGFGDVIKFIFRFREAFWEENYPGLGFLFSGAAVPTWWTQAPSGDPVLTGWMPGRAARASAHLTDTQLIETAMQSLAQLSSLDKQTLEGMLLEARIANWSADPYTLGAYTYATVGSDTARALLSRPIGGRIFFAGEYQDDGPAMGTVEAAFRSGQEIARRLLRVLRSDWQGASCLYRCLFSMYMLMNLIFLLIGFVVLVLILVGIRRRKNKTPPPPPKQSHELLIEHVRFYRSLNVDDQQAFRQRVAHFLSTVSITPVGNVKVTELDRLYVAAAAIIPIFAFKDWAYNNLNEVLIYPGAFTKDFSGRPEDSNVLGMVGDGAMHRMMILSIGSLRAGFEQSGAGNTGIHEFVHLLDKADGATDGVPEMMLPRDLMEPWIQYMHRAIHEIRSGESDINPYAATNEAEFFAVISEYFFQKPGQLKEHHPELWNMLERIYGIGE